MMARNWGWVALRGAAALSLGGLTLYRPGMRLLSLILLFGVYACADGAFTLTSALVARRPGAQRPALLLAGVAGLAVGAFLLAEPHHVAVAPLNFIAAWAVITGAAGIVAGSILRRSYPDEWLRLLAGALSVLLAGLLVGLPGAGGFTVMMWIGGWGVLVGLLLLVLGLRLRTRRGRLAPEAPPPRA